MVPTQSRDDLLAVCFGDEHKKALQNKLKGLSKVSGWSRLKVGTTSWQFVLVMNIKKPFKIN